MKSNQLCINILRYSGSGHHLNIVSVSPCVQVKIRLYAVWKREVVKRPVIIKTAYPELVAAYLGSTVINQN